MHRKLTAMLFALVLIALAALAGVAAAAESAAKPGFSPGKWQGTGTFSGSSTDGPMKTVFSGKARFTLTVKPDLSATGTGTWAMTMKGSGPVTSVMKGTAGLTFRGVGSDVRYSGTQKVAGTVSDGTLSQPIRFTRALKGRLVISRAGSCKVVGSSPMGGGLVFKWTATKGAGTCL
jgi:hypothetical protein